MNLESFEKEHNNSGLLHDDAHLLKQKIENRKVKQKKIKKILTFLVIVILILTSLVVYSQYKLYKLSKEEMVLNNGGKIELPKTQEELLSRIKRHILVPDIAPQIAEIQDVEKLKNSQLFFKDAKNGDMVLVYNNLILIYRPSEDIIIASGDITGVGEKKP